ncbi:glycosyltransferase family 2 protein [Anditalea andensis]|uniref:Glycosyltransferase 2-like domain-containing protein n=1 Tax=Anditalea andensis TaxID=1048983 RepID=A0A074KWM7_9BACT|nr:glycosyltransferase family A protein [Anditalea andensis]KEO72595.1 hypothetical protein EL17_17815 [Anditalea andensis]
MKDTTVTVLMPVYNGAEFLRETIDSILSQTYEVFEFLIINDGSTDDSEEIILSYDDPRIVYLKNESNIGIIDTLNRGLDHSRSKYIIRMDADDLALPHRIAVQVAYMEDNPDVVLSGSGKINFVNGNSTQDMVIKPIVGEQLLYFNSIFNTSIPHPSAIFRNDIVQKYHLRYDHHFYGAEDKALWLDLAAYGKINNVPEPLIRYRNHANQISYTKLEEGRTSSVAKTFETLNKLGFSLEENQIKALSLLCYPHNCDDIHMLESAQRLADKLTDKFREIGMCDAAYVEDFFTKRIKRIIVWSSPVGISLFRFIYKNKRFKLREFGYVFYKKALLRAKK